MQLRLSFKTKLTSQKINTLQKINKYIIFFKKTNVRQSSNFLSIFQLSKNRTGNKSEKFSGLPLN